MAPEKKDKKRKAAPTATTAVADPPAKKSKKVDATPSAKSSEEAPKSILKKKKDTSEEVTNGTATSTKSLKVDGEPARKVKPRKRAADFLSDDEDSEREIITSEKQSETETSKPSKKQAKKSAEEQKPAKVKESQDKSKKNGVKEKPKKQEVVSEESDDEPSEESNAESDSNVDADSDEGEDDRTAELIKGFEGSGDEDPSEDEGFDPNQPVPRIPDSKKTKRKILKKQKKNDEDEEPGTVYIGRIPHGFYEHQMRAYFSQFGDITRLRLSRNRVTGRSKHYAFVEFASKSVAKIVAETMNNYLLYGHILKVKFVPQEQLHPEIWKGANRRFKRTPWNRIEKHRLEKGKTREKWAKSIEQEEKRRRAKAEKLKALGYEFEMPALKSVDEVPVQGKETPKAIEEADSVPNGTEKESAVKAVEASSTKDADKQVDDDDQKSSKQTKKEKSKEKKESKENKENKENKEKKAASVVKTADAAATTSSPAGKTGEKKAKKDKNKVKA
ncbi:hypothetical protein VTN77DRAFT_6023 [Rasamsonia byssochlamydoides]|uniref:uncharacterized protein n=1 Tax=Rasamsonia byssochlamydoides TaxID=89139 RepID=UPI003743F7BB